MQHKAMSLMSRKMAAAQALEGEFSEEGLAAMAGEDNLQMALAKNLSERIDDSDMQRSWGKIKSGPKKVKASPLDKLPPALQLVGEAIIDSQFPKIHEEIAAVDAAFTKLHPKREPEPVKSFVKPKLTLHVPEPVFEDYDNFDDDFEMPELTPEIMAKMFANSVEHLADDPDEEDDFEMPELTPEIMAKMFANMMAAGQMKELSV